MKYASRMAYRSDFFISMFAFGLFQLLTPLMMVILYSVGVTLPGWTIAQMLLLTGLLGASRGFAYMVFNGFFWKTQEHVRDGTFDKYLTKPVSPFILLFMYGFDEEDLGQFLAGLAVLVYALTIQPIPLERLWILPFSIIAGALVYFSLSIFAGAMTIVFVKMHRLSEFFQMAGILGSYPKTIYGRGVTLLVSVIVPVAVASYYPAAYLLGFATEGYLLALLCTAILLSIAIAFWHGILKKYRSAGG